MLTKLKALAKHLENEFSVYRLVLKHPQTPLIAKIFLGLAVGYLLLPFDLIPDFIPVLGQLDDVVIIPVLVYIALLFIPPEIIEQCRAQVVTALASATQKTKNSDFALQFEANLTIIFIATLILYSQFLIKKV